MARIQSDYNQYVPKNTASQTLHSGAGKVHGIILSCESANYDTLDLYDNTAASGNVLIHLGITAYNTPCFINFKSLQPLIFSTGLTAVTSAGCSAFVITEFNS